MDRNIELLQANLSSGYTSDSDSDDNFTIADPDDYMVPINLDDKENMTPAGYAQTHLNMRSRHVGGHRVPLGDITHLILPDMVKADQPDASKQHYKVKAMTKSIR